MTQSFYLRMQRDYDWNSQYHFVDASESDQGTAGDGSSVKDIVDSVGTSKKATIVFSHSGTGNTTTYTFSTSEVIPDNFEVLVENGAVLSVATGITVEFGGSIWAGRNQWISLTGTGSVIFDERFISEIFPEWWGALGDDSTDSTDAIQDAIDCAEAMGGCIVSFAAATYRFTTLTMDDPGVTLRGMGPDATVLKTTSGTGNIITIGDTGSNYNASGGIRDISLYTTGARTAGFMIYIDGCEQGIINNIKIGEDDGYAVGSGIYFGSDLSTLWYVTNSVIEIQGAFHGIHLAGSSDQYLSNLWIRGDGSTDNSIGIYVDNNAGAWFKDIDIVQFYEGILLGADDGDTISWLNFDNILVDQNELYGLSVHSTHVNAVIKGISFVSCWFSTNGASDANAKGVYIRETAGAINGITFVNPRVIGNGGHGFQVDAGPIHIGINGGMFGGNSAQAANTYNGIYMNGADNWSITGVMSGAV
ncbi:MAG: glycoside hydrolase family 55 protein, partial [Gammaproteobacteria bacterium]|nr:glycoside hydrolase family 55 protein [Gammaproteobacteria bacterium]MBU2685536.1 glycoside hydrolase family 55 protein [Gammaproteobacteria bacterium]